MNTTHFTNTRFSKRFRKSKAALPALVYIFLVIVIAVFCYPLSTDDSADADTVLMEIGTRKPGFSCYMLKKYYPQNEVEQSTLNYLIHGRIRDAELLPIVSYQFKNDSVIVQHILDDQNTETLAFSISQLLQARNTPANIEASLVLKRNFWLGTDRYGRDVFSRLLIGSRVSMAVGFIAVIISLFIGVLLGALSGYFGGKIDQLVTWLINVIWAIPTLLLVFAITFALGKGFWQIFIAVGCTMWVGTARLIRGQVMSLREMEYIQATKVMGFSSARIIIKHILPNIMGPTMVLAASNFATAILIEAGLSFLGIGVQPPTSSWGLMIKENYNFIITNHPMLAIIPGIAIMLIVLAFNIIGNALRDALDVKG
ncbi:MAG: ABC transporter permease [Bacteroidetes bacterium]|nr:ABC transporter permease [Bacteroidota bacterium]